MLNNHRIKGRVFNLLSGTLTNAEVVIKNGRIAEILPVSEELSEIILPGLIDAHVHIESSMLPPPEFTRLAVQHGTVATVSDPHEIANVLSATGVHFMLDNARQVPFKFFFGAPSCVPATSFETAGACLDSKQVSELLALPEIYYLSEVMNFPGVIAGDEELVAKITAARRLGKVVDGHAPGLRGVGLKKYAAHGITSDHECTYLEEALEKIGNGMKIIIREGSAARNYSALNSLIRTHPDQVMFGSDDKHPDELARSHIDELIRRSLEIGHDELSILRSACVVPVKHYGLNVGLLQVNDPADLIVAAGLKDFRVLRTYIDGVEVAANSKSNIERIEITPINNFSCPPLEGNSLEYPAAGRENIPIIEVIDGELITKKLFLKPKVQNDLFVQDIERDILKIVVYNRYKQAEPAVAFIKNFGLKSGAIASSVAHDSHNIVAVGSDDKSICKAVNLIVKNKGGVSLASDLDEQVLPLEIAGLMSTLPAEEVAAKYEQLDLMAKALGSKLRAPFMSLSFMALLVIPEIKLSDLGLFDGENFSFYPN